MLPSIEDLIILKLMSGERKDIHDVKKILAQQWPTIDKGYLQERAQQAGLEKELRKILREARAKMRRKPPIRLVRLVPGLALPEYMAFLLEHCEPTGHTKRAIEAGHLLRVDYHPPYLQFHCKDTEQVVEEARKRRLRIYKARIYYISKQTNKKH